MSFERKPEQLISLPKRRKRAGRVSLKRRYVKGLKPSQQPARMLAVEGKVAGLRRTDDPFDVVLYRDFPETKPDEKILHKALPHPDKFPRIPEPQNKGPLWAAYVTLDDSQLTAQFLNMLQEEIRQLNPAKLNSPIPMTPAKKFDPEAKIKRPKRKLDIDSFTESYPDAANDREISALELAELAASWGQGYKKPKTW